MLVVQISTDVATRRVWLEPSHWKEHNKNKRFQKRNTSLKQWIVLISFAFSCDSDPNWVPRVHIILWVATVARNIKQALVNEARSRDMAVRFSRLIKAKIEVAKALWTNGDIIFKGEVTFVLSINFYNPLQACLFTETLLRIGLKCDSKQTKL